MRRRSSPSAISSSSSWLTACPPHTISQSPNCTIRQYPASFLKAFDESKCLSDFVRAVVYSRDERNDRVDRRPRKEISRDGSRGWMMTERGDETPSGRMRQLTRERCLCYHTFRSGGGHPLNHPRCIWSWAGVPNKGVVPRRVVQPKTVGRARWAGHFQSGTSERRSRIELSGKPEIF